MDSLRQQAWRRERAFIFSPLSAPGSADGRDAIAQACARVAAEVTGRRSERLHRFRHLVAFELITPMFLAGPDAEWLKGRGLDDQGEVWRDVLLPRDLLGMVVVLGHADWRVTLRCYFHLQWLLRSRQDAAIGEQYMHRRIVAFATGLTLPAVDKIVQQAKDKEPCRAWFDHFREVRVVPVPERCQPVVEPGPVRHWTASELDELFRLANRMGSLDQAILSSGGTREDARKIRRHLQIAERRLGRKLFRESVSERSSSKRQRVVRELDGELKRFLLDWMGGDDREGTLAMRDLMESMSPRDAEAVIGSVGTIQALERKLQEGATFECILKDAGDGIATLKVKNFTSASARESNERVSGMSLSQEVKRAAAIAWIADRL